MDTVAEMNAGRGTPFVFQTQGRAADFAVEDAGYEPNGYFWERVVEFLAPGIESRVELDSEAEMFCAYGSADSLVQVHDLLAPLVDDPEAVKAVIAQAEAQGVDLGSFED